MTFYDRLDDYVERYIQDPINVLDNMKNYFDDEELWSVIEYLLDKIEGLQEIRKKSNEI